MRTVVVIAGGLLAGCFYVEPINQRPSLDIRQEVVGPVFRGEQVSFDAVVVDPDGHDVDLTWRAYMCTDAADAASCDDAPMFSDILTPFVFTVPMLRADAATPVESMRIVLDGRDDHGATAKPTDILQLDVLDRKPEVAMRRYSIYEQMGQYVVGMPVDIDAKYTDGDDALDALTVEWKVYAPSQVPINLVDKTVPQTEPPLKRDVGKILTPQIIGEWVVELVVTDPVGNHDTKSVAVSVIDDRAPCIQVVSPILPPDPATPLVVMDPTLFQVPIVSDDLDSYPRTSGGSLFGEPSFAWSIKVGSGPRQPISGATGSGTLFDPSVYSPGTQVELRVEIADRKGLPVSCADGDLTCPTTGTCFQRQTWKVEAR